MLILLFHKKMVGASASAPYLPIHRSASTAHILHIILSYARIDCGTRGLQTKLGQAKVKLKVRPRYSTNIELEVEK